MGVGDEKYCSKMHKVGKDAEVDKMILTKHMAGGINLRSLHHITE